MRRLPSCESAAFSDEADRSTGSSTRLQGTNVTDAGAVVQLCRVQGGLVAVTAPLAAACLHGPLPGPVLVRTAQAEQQPIRHQMLHIWRLPQELCCGVQGQPL